MESKMMPMRNRRDLVETTALKIPLMTYYFPELKERMLSAAAESGADIKRGAKVIGLKPAQNGAPALAQAEIGGQTNEFAARFAVIATGRNTEARKWVDFKVETDPPRMIFSGALIKSDNFSPDDGYNIMFPSLGLITILMPQRGGGLRVYIGYIKDGKECKQLLQGEQDLSTFIELSKKAGAPEKLFENAELIGPLNSFISADEWVDYPYKNGVALIGNAAASNDHCWSEDPAITLLSARLLSDALLADADWEKAGNAYAREFHQEYDLMHVFCRWYGSVLINPGYLGEAKRMKIFAYLMAKKMMRVNNIIVNGPNFAKQEGMREFIYELVKM
jgi:flavin-dependent dehydrogenase